MPQAEITRCRLLGVLAEVRAGIMGELGYPRCARQRRVEGRAIVVLKRDGTGAVTPVEIGSPEPVPLICAAVLQAVRRVGPFPGAGKAIREGEMPAPEGIAMRFELKQAGF